MGVEKPKATGRYIYTKVEREREDGSVGYRASRKELVKRRLKLVTRLEELKKERQMVKCSSIKEEGAMQETGVEFNCGGHKIRVNFTIGPL